MSKPKSSAPWPHCALPASLIAERCNEIALLQLNRPEKRNAFNPPLVRGIEAFFSTLPDDIHAVVIHGAGEHFSAGLDLSDLREQNASEGMFHSRMWHQAFEKVEFGRVPVISVLHGAVVGADWNSPPRRISALPRVPPITRCRKAFAASLSAAAAPCASRA